MRGGHETTLKCMLGGVKECGCVEVCVCEGVDALKCDCVCVKEVNV